ncbi:ATP-binding cassette domain-containing protein [Streptomyces triticiradicis]|uniref:ATP-binding cassette domain-containing protein n=1 Tax=Streptomyces triticiradicis TaxID=2651189 RepID=A0A7J5D261_9ACTN|nr:ATP-binding cassette domain-containing protein [Streptomyces triticiradicis]KAB1977403.1 ATP-binding cassette domain-containing protein [Streptomyces triticiradicis]
MSSVVRVTNLEQSYRDRSVISGLNLDIHLGTVGLLGPNGAGKTTLLRTLATIAPPRSGKIEILGEPVVSESSAKNARRNIGYLPQDFGYYPNFSVRDFVHYCAWLREIPNIEEEVSRAIDLVGLSDCQKRKMKSLSGGMIRRAGIATAIVGTPKLILLDEPTVGLDPAQRLDFRNLIRNLDSSTVVISTHLVEDVSTVCDAVMVMNQGKLLFHGTPESLAGRAVEDMPGDSLMERGYMATLAGKEAIK